MVAVFNKELLSWYLITLKLKETVEANLPKSSAPATPTSSDLGAGPPAQPPLLLLTQGGEEGGGERSPPSPRIVRSPTPPPRPPTAGGGDSEWVISIREKLEQARQADAACPWAKLCIYRVPKSLREGDEKSYVPQVVSLGPFHHGRRRLRDMEPHKWRALHRVLKRTGRDVRAYLDAVRPLEDRVRACYEGRARRLPSRELVLSLVLDGTFALNLINSEDDVRYLHQRGIIEHWLGNEREVADLFNRLCQEVVFDINDSYLSALSEQVNRHYSHKWSTWTAALKHNYFGNPWAIISFVAAAVLLLLTFTQTFYSVYTYYRPIQQY